MNRSDEHRRTSWIVDALLGGQDGLVNVLGVVLGVATASSERHLVLAAGTAAALAEFVSMGAVAYTSRMATGALYESERRRELRHLQARAEPERDEIREIFAGFGFTGELLDRVVEKITSDPAVWVDVMMALEHRLSQVSRTAALRSGLLVGASSLLGSLPPLLPFLALPVVPATWASMSISALALFVFGAYKAAKTLGRPLRGGLELAAIGIATALVGYAVGLLFR